MIVARAGGDGKNKNKEQIGETYEKIKYHTDPTSLRATVEQEYIVVEAGKHFARYGVAKPTGFGGAQHEISVAQKNLIKDIVEKYGKKYDKLSAIGSVYMLHKKPYPEAEDYIVVKWMSFLKEFEYESDLRKRSDKVVEDIKHCFGVVKTTMDIMGWYARHVAEGGRENYPDRLRPIVHRTPF